MYRIRLQDFEGPLDLLLFFIRRDELDIFDIPIAQIADEFLEYVRMLQEIDLDGVGDFIYMAAVLISVKAKMLLPRPEVDEEGELVDPRRELVERLLEYVRFKEAAEELSRRHEARSAQYVRGAAAAQEHHVEEGPAAMELDATVFDLVSALRHILTESQQAQEPVHAVQREEYSVEAQQTYVLDTVLSKPIVSFADLVRARSKPFIIATFLAILEMARQGLVRLSLAATGRDFYVLRPDEAMPEERAKPTNGASGKTT